MSEMSELVRILAQIRDELREMNGKDSEGNRLWGKGKRPDIQNPPYIPSPMPYPVPAYPPYWNTVTAQDTGYLVNDHQGERLDPDPGD
jgi:hypothetical protein